MNSGSRLIVSLNAGVLFGFGLSLSGMIDPARVKGFLDVMSGHWDPSLLFVLSGAVLVAMAGVALQQKMASPLLDSRFHLPEKTQIDRRLLIGSAIFGIGWGLAGLCPGPAVSAISTGLAPVAFFVITMVLGMYAHDRFIARGAR